MKTICLYFEIHQNIHLKRYRFFEIGTDHYYYDDYESERAITETAERSYIPALKTLLQMTETYGKKFKMAFSLSGCAIEQLEMYAPQVIELLQELNNKGNVEFLAEPYSHGLASLSENGEASFRAEIEHNMKRIKELFGQKPKVFRNSCLIYSDEIGARIADMGFKGVMTEGAKHILGWKSPHFVYSCAANPKLKVLMRDYKLSDDISLRFNDSSWNEYPLFASTWADWVAALPQEEQIVNIFMELCAFGVYQPLSSNILEFMKALPACCAERGIEFATPSEIISKVPAVGPIEVAYPISWVDEERDASCWLGNVMQREAFDKLYSVAERVTICQDQRIKKDWDYLQASNNFRFMSTKPQSYGAYRGIYDSPYDAFTNYMNIVGDFINRVNNIFPSEVDNEEYNALLTTIRNQGDEIEVKDKEIERLSARIKKLSAQAPAEEKPAKKAAAPKKEAKPAAPKAEKKPVAPKADKKPAKKAADKPAK
ncbi:MAG: alpha-amylase [Bacteroidaceae bacterium]|nr:alpha-amylase [Bacteroidaceae bacterium]